MYKINIHAHTIFSDGANTPLAMAIEAKRLGFTALVITDHCYGNHGDLCSDYSLTTEKMRLLKKACQEARHILPVIVGMEFSLCGEEVLIFGGAMIKKILAVNEMRNISTALEWKRETGAAVVLCHPSSPENWEVLRPLLDGFERFNAGQNYFKKREVKSLEGLPGWCNSDAHQVEGMDRAHNLVDTKITTESKLIKYIKSGKQPEFYCKLDDDE